MSAPRCLHRKRGVCLACRSFAALAVVAVQDARKGDQPWTRTFANLNRRAGGGG